ncbi:MAG: cyclopropane-fatty-acyl-phospholipid synthase family protein [Ilumatobacteraceae bacterium]
MSTISADRLLRHAERDVATRPGPVTGGAAALGRLVLGRATTDRLRVDDVVPGRPPTHRTYGADGPLAPGAIEAHVTVFDDRAYAALVREGSIGFGRGYIERWWTSDDPVAVVQFAIRNMAGLDRLRNRTRRWTGWVSDPIRRALPRDSRERNRDDIGAHYDIGNDFFSLFLDETMTYSSAVFADPSMSLADASRHKYDLLLDALGVGAGDRLLEVGTGWGGMALRAAGERGARVTTTTISSEQHAEASRRVDDAGLADRVTLLMDDWRDLTGTYDHVVSIEMIEAVDWRDYDDYFATIDRSLAPGGRAAIQAICLPDDRWGGPRTPRTSSAGSCSRTGSCRRSRDRRLGRAGDVDAGGRGGRSHRALRRDAPSVALEFDARIADVDALGLDERFRRLWRMYLAYCEAAFLERHCHLNHVILEKVG